MSNIKKLREKRDAKAKEARNILDDATGTFDQAASEKVDAIYADIDLIDKQIAQAQRLLDDEARLQSEADDPDTPSNGNGGGLPGLPGDEVRQRVFDAFLRNGQRGVNSLPEDVLAAYSRDVQNAQSTGTDSEGGYLVPTGFGGQLLEKMKAYGGIRNRATVISTESGNVIPWPTVDETSEEGEWVDENVEAADGDIAFGTVSIAAHKASSRVVTVPIELLQDSGIGNLEGMIGSMLATRLSRTTNKGYTVGNNVGKPNGAITASALGHTTAAGLTDSFGWDDLVELEHSLDPAYRRNATWQFNDAVLKAAKLMKDSDGRPIWMPGVSNQAPAEILGYEYDINQDMAVPAAGARSIGFGDFSKYLIRDVMNITLFRFTDSAYAKKGQVGFLAWLRTDGELIDASNESIRHMLQAAA
ncbi:phage major capsid protein [Roseovarius sp. B08]|uniref:phage major capsid protein n=1 Tax=Roseovarius sp. B08 TaxID=3449223 RepID=UPI003EDC13E6